MENSLNPNQSLHLHRYWW